MATWVVHACPDHATALAWVARLEAWAQARNIWTGQHQDEEHWDQDEVPETCPFDPHFECSFPGVTYEVTACPVVATPPPEEAPDGDRE